MKLTKEHHKLVEAARRHLDCQSIQSWIALQAAANAAGKVPERSTRAGAAEVAFNLRVDVLIAAKLYAMSRSEAAYRALVGALDALDDFNHGAAAPAAVAVAVR